MQPYRVTHCWLQAQHFMLAPTTWPRRFDEMLDEMDAQGLEPNATLHHFTHPVSSCDSTAQHSTAQCCTAPFHNVCCGITL
jgi:hypothetical protein